LTVDFLLSGSTLLVTTTVSPSILTWSLDISKGSGSVLSTRVSQPSAADSWCAKGRQGQSKEAFSGEWKLTGDSEVIIEKGRQRRCLKTSTAGRKSAGVEVPVVRRSVSVNVTDAVTQSITDDVGRSGCRPSKGRFAHWQCLPGGRPIQYLITLVHC
jgi:hypothetical protein